MKRLLALVLFAVPVLAADKVIAIRAARLIDARSAAAISPAVVVVRET